MCMIKKTNGELNIVIRIGCLSAPSHVRGRGRRQPGDGEWDKRYED